MYSDESHTAPLGEGFKDEPGESSTEPISGIAEAVLPATITFINAITCHTLATVFAESIEGQIIGFTGNGPYYETDLISLAGRLKAIPDAEGIAWDALKCIIIGTEEFDRDYIRHATMFRHIKYFTQEEFLGMLLFGNQPFTLTPISMKSLELSHEGMQFLYSIPQPAWANDPTDSSQPIEIIKPLPASSPKPVGSPATTSSNAIPPPQGMERMVKIPDMQTTPSPPSGERDTSQINLRMESELRRLGYHVKKGGIRTQRRLALQAGVAQLGLRNVVNHLVWLIKFQRNQTRMQDAVFHWREDLHWLKKVYDSHRW